MINWLIWREKYQKVQTYYIDANSVINFLIRLILVPNILHLFQLTPFGIANMNTDFSM